VNVRLWPNPAVTLIGRARKLSGDKLPLTAFGVGGPQLGSVDIHAMARKAAERWMKAQKLVSVLS
jgi:hypothetical protein